MEGLRIFRSDGSVIEELLSARLQDNTTFKVPTGVDHMNSNEMIVGRYYVDANEVEHGCCWNAAVVRKCEPGKGMYGGDVELVCECDESRAQLICDTLNAALDAGDPRAL